MRWSVVIPVLNEAELLPRCLAAVARELPPAEVIVVDGGSRDGGVELARRHGARVLTAAGGRGAQCRAGVEASRGEWLLLLHGDTLLPNSAGRLLAEHARRHPERVATFRLSFDWPHWFLRASAWCSRFDTMFTRFGDMGIVVRRAVWDRLGGMPAWPLLEDVAFLRAARAAGGVVSLPAAVLTSARRYRGGPIRRQWANLRLLLRYRAGVDPWQLAAKYGGAERPRARMSLARAGESG
ncbi:MAG: TIGR04283 family arsenosugar biosynthesis glycosyltransferase [Verrucomicrobia bacterium]|nr:TIGR04283 family arsenosugar biosynthesis glycosyltransferase [Verrucomicrobiota bacterium]